MPVLRGALASAKPVVAGEQWEDRTAEKTVEAVLNQHRYWLMSVPGVVGTAIGDCAGKPCIKVLVIEKTEELVGKVPRSLEGYPVIIEESGEIRALPPR